jgi:hypothetical protein
MEPKAEHLWSSRFFQKKNVELILTCMCTRFCDLCHKIYKFPFNAVADQSCIKVWVHFGSVQDKVIWQFFGNQYDCNSF